MRQVPRLVKDIVHCQAEVERPDVLGGRCVPLPLALPVSHRISPLEDIGDVAGKFEPFLGSVSDIISQLGVQGVPVEVRIQGIP